MTTATATPLHPPGQTTVNLREPGDLIAALPPLIGYHPTDSIVVLFLNDAKKMRIRCVLRAPLPLPEDEDELVSLLCDNVLNSEVPVVQLCVIGGAGTSLPGKESGTVVALPTRPPRRALVLKMTQLLRGQGVEVVESLWAESTRHNATWRDYAHPEITGLVSDPDVSLLAVATIASGGITYDSREALVNSLRGDEKDLARRSKALDKLTDDMIPRELPSTAAGIRAVEAELKNIVDGSFAVSDELVIRLARMLGDHQVRDAALQLTLTPRHSAAAERLWLELTRETPPPERAEPATLLAFAAYHRGDGVLANVAVQQAQQAQPGHMLSELLSRAIAAGLSPKDLVTAVNAPERPDLDRVVPQRREPED